jgi:hypothetical protein
MSAVEALAELAWTRSESAFDPFWKWTPPKLILPHRRPKTVHVLHSLVGQWESRDETRRVDDDRGIAGHGPNGLDHLG